MCCMADANDVFAAFDQPDLKAVFDVLASPPRPSGPCSATASPPASAPPKGSPSAARAHPAHQHLSDGPGRRPVPLGAHRARRAALRAARPPLARRPTSPTARRPAPCPARTREAGGVTAAGPSRRPGGQVFGAGLHATVAPFPRSARDPSAIGTVCVGSSPYQEDQGVSVGSGEKIFPPPFRPSRSLHPDLGCDGSLLDVLRTMNGVTARNLPPSAFAPVMATGIVSQGLAVVGARRLSDALLDGGRGGLLQRAAGGAGVAGAAVPGKAADLRNPGRLFGFFTFVAGSEDGAAVRLAPGLASGRVGPAGAGRTRRRPPAGVRGAHGAPARRGRDGAARGRTWFLCVVGIQSAVLATAALAPGRARPAEALGWVAGGAAVHGEWPRRSLRRGVSGYGHGAVAALRITYGSLRDQPPLPVPGWCTRGSTPPAPGGDRVRPIALWGWATCLLPPLLAAGIWRHLLHRVPLGTSRPGGPSSSPRHVRRATAALGETEGSTAWCSSDISRSGWRWVRGCWSRPGWCGRDGGTGHRGRIRARRRVKRCESPVGGRSSSKWRPPPTCLPGNV
ncbi:hypothetical protein SANTM175S_10611 [Streptomyces antimycoticus]